MTTCRARLVQAGVVVTIALGLLVGSTVEASADTIQLDDPAQDAIGLVDMTTVKVSNGADAFVVDVTAPGFDPTARNGAVPRVAIWSALYVGLNFKNDSRGWTIVMVPSEDGTGVQAGLGPDSEDDGGEGVPCPGLRAAAVVGRLTLTVPQTCFGDAAGPVWPAVQLDGRTDFVGLPVYIPTSQPAASDSTQTRGYLKRG